MKNDYKKHKKQINIFKYENENGEFNYNTYKECQIALNKAKINYMGPTYEVMKSLYHKVIKKYRPDKIMQGICHGTRRGTEQKHLRNITDGEIIGTDISPTAVNFPNTIQWDFHKIKEEWINKFELIYTNSLDQSYDPIHCINQWLKTLAPGGVCAIHTYSSVPSLENIEEKMNLLVADPRLPNNLPKHAGDPFVATLEGYKIVCEAAIAKTKGHYNLFVDNDGPGEVIVIVRTK